MVLEQRIEDIIGYLEEDSRGRGEVEGDSGDYLNPIEVGRLYGKVYKALQGTMPLCDKLPTSNSLEDNLTEYKRWAGGYWEDNLNKEEAKERLESILEEKESWR